VSKTAEKVPSQSRFFNDPLLLHTNFNSYTRDPRDKGLSSDSTGSDETKNYGS